VATLFDPRRVSHVAHLAAASSVAASPEAAAFAASLAAPPLASPHVADEFRRVDLPLGEGAHSVVVVNVHLKMQEFPRIALELAELLARLGVPTSADDSAAASIAQCPDFPACPRGGHCSMRHGGLTQEQWERAVLIGDFNAGNLSADADLRAILPLAGGGGRTTAWGALYDASPFAAISEADPASIQAQRQVRRSGACRYGARCSSRSCTFQHPPGRAIDLVCDDHVLLGPRVELADGGALVPLPQLDKRVRHPGSPHSIDKALWGSDAAPYTVSEHNAALLERGELASDHPLIAVEVRIRN